MSNYTGKVIVPGITLPRRGINWLLADFDGTLSLIREGWQEVMIQTFLDLIPNPQHEDTAEIRRMLRIEIDKLTGKPTIHQMRRFAQIVTERGKTALEPLDYKTRYLEQLKPKIDERKRRIGESTTIRDQFVVHGAVNFLSFLRDLGFTLVLASGTDHDAVVKEAKLLGLDQLFGDYIFGALDNKPDADKGDVIDHIIHTTGLKAEQMLGIGDGYVELLETKNRGGIAGALATDEARNGEGRMDEWKVNRLGEVRPDFIIPDFRDAITIVKQILGHAV